MGSKEPLINMFSVFHGEDKYNMFCNVKLIDNAVVTEPQRELSFMIADEGFSAPRVFRKRFDFRKDSHKELPVGFMERLKIGFSLLRKLDLIDHTSLSRDLKS